MAALERKGIKIKKLVLMSGFMDFEGLSGSVENEPFRETFDWKFNFEKIKSLAEEIVVIGDNNDTDVTPVQAHKLAKHLDVKANMIDAE